MRTPAGAFAVVRYDERALAELGSDAGIDWHGHSDRGFGVASALAALEAGATGCTALRSASGSGPATRRWTC